MGEYLLVARKWIASPGALSIVTGAMILLPIAVTAICSTFVASHHPAMQYADGLDQDGMPTPPCRRFPFGTDGLGRDVFSRTVHGALTSLTAGLAAACLASGIGVVIGLTAGYGGGFIDTVLMRLTDVMMAIPTVLLAMALAGLMDGQLIWSHPEIRLERGLITVLVVVGAVSWTGVARVVRTEVRSLVQRPFIEAAEVLGCSATRVLLTHILPNIFPSVIVLTTMNTAWTIALEAGLGFLGIGVPPPSPSWGRMVSEGQPYMLVAPWIVLSSGGAIVATVLACNLIGYGAQAQLDPHRQVH